MVPGRATGIEGCLTVIRTRALVVEVADRGGVLVEGAVAAVVGTVDRAPPLEQPLSTRTTATTQATTMVRRSRAPTAARLTTLERPTDPIR